jgi:hypothetical protein
MARGTLNLLHPKDCEHAKPGVVLRDGGGLYLEVTSSGRKYWRFRYTRPNSAALPSSKRRNRISFGQYPKPVSLADARAERDRCRAELAKGVDPLKKSANSKQEKLLQRTTRYRLFLRFGSRSGIGVQAIDKSGKTR